MPRMMKSLPFIVTLMLVAGFVVFIWRGGAKRLNDVVVEPEFAATAKKPVSIQTPPDDLSTAPAAHLATVAMPAAPSQTSGSEAPVAKAKPAIKQRATALSTPRTQLPAEKGLVTEQGVNISAVGTLMKGEEFDELLDRVSAQSLQEPLAIDLTALYSAAAAEASRSAADVFLQRNAGLLRHADRYFNGCVCGMVGLLPVEPAGPGLHDGNACQDVG